MKTGKELLEDLKAELAQAKKNQDEREERINRQELEISDSFLSRDAANYNIRDIELKIRVVENKGLWSFEKLADLDGNILEDARKITTRYGECWVNNGEFIGIPSAGCRAGKKVWVEAGFRNHTHGKKELLYGNREDQAQYYHLCYKSEQLGMKEKGYQVLDVDRPAWVSDNGVFEIDYNYYTGE